MKFSRKGICICAIAVGIIASISTAFSVFTLTGTVYKNNPLEINVLPITLENQKTIIYKNFSGLKYFKSTITKDTMTFNFNFDNNAYRQENDFVDNSLLLVNIDFKNANIYQFVKDKINSGLDFIEVYGNMYDEEVGKEVGYFSIKLDDLYSIASTNNNTEYKNMITFDNTSFTISTYIPISSDLNATKNIKSTITAISNAPFHIDVNFNFILDNGDYIGTFSQNEFLNSIDTIGVSFVTLE